METPARIAPEEALVELESAQTLNAETSPHFRSFLLATSEGIRLLECTYSQLPILWAIDETGHFRFGVEEIITSSSKRLVRPRFVRDPLLEHQKRLGHPALVAGKGARISGELWFDPGWGAQRRGWKLTNASGRYGLVETRTPQHLSNVQKLLRDFEIEVDCLFIPVGG
ncbi:hypothetical protein [Roseicyclus sp.]